MCIPDGSCSESGRMVKVFSGWEIYFPDGKISNSVRLIQDGKNMNSGLKIIDSGRGI